MPNFLSIEHKPFDPALYEDEMEEDEVLDEEGRARLKLKVMCMLLFVKENVIPQVKVGVYLNLCKILLLVHSDIHFEGWSVRF